MFFLIGRKPGLADLELKSYSRKLSLDKLTIGVDNIRYDVRLSPAFRVSVRELAAKLVAIHSQTGNVFERANDSVTAERDYFQKLCVQIMTDAINRSKSTREVQIDYLAQVASVRLILQEVQNQYDALAEELKIAVRKAELSKNPEYAIRYRKELDRIQQDKKGIIARSVHEAFEYFVNIQNKEVRELREVNFGNEQVLPDEVFLNPLLHTVDPNDEYLQLEEYDMLLGRRIEDPDKYDVLISQFKQILHELKEKDPNLSNHGLVFEDGLDESIDEWLMEPQNADQMFNYFQTLQNSRTFKKEKKDKEESARLKKLASAQKKNLEYFYNQFRKTGLIERIVATYEMQPTYLEYCPPLTPQLIAQYLASPKTRKSIEVRLNRLQQFYDKPLSLKSLYGLIPKVRKVRIRLRKLYFVRFMKGFLRYHRDTQNLKMINTAMDSINLTEDEKLIKLSRANHSLHEFLITDDQATKVRQIINHVIIKADIRGSTDITHRMLEKGLNPASYFSLNLFDPISRILHEYGAEKVFVEGDAIILSICEHENSPEEWYSVARACGLAIEILGIVQRCNMKNRDNKLPVVEMGIGISSQKGAPVFLFDGDHRIMISSAINLADRLSGCSKSVRKHMESKKGMFNLYVFLNISEKQIEKTADNLYVRYNVNGIELSEAAFQKLTNEIDLKKISLKAGSDRSTKDNITIYFGKYPAVSGQIRELIIREAKIPRVKSDTLELVRYTEKYYYEVCYNSKLYSIAHKM